MQSAKPKAVQLIRGTRNVLVSQTPSGLRILVSDFGLARRLGQDQSSFAPTANNLAGSLGWRAPECIRGVVRLNEGFDASSSVGSSGGIANAEDGVARSRLTKAVDLFALGCLYFWVLLSGEHPFGETYNRESNIVKGEAVNMGMLSLLGEEREEVEDLVGRLLSSEPDARYVLVLVALRYIPQTHSILQTIHIRMSRPSDLLASRQTSRLSVRRFRPIRNHADRAG